MRYRIYIDESGNHDLRGSTDPNNRYLGLTGIIIQQGPSEERMRKAIAHLKSHFPTPSSGDSIILHRRDIVNRLPPFDVLLDTEKAERFDRDLMLVFTHLDYTAVTVVIDKLEHVTRYVVWQVDPYHYCLEAMMERYCMFLRGVNGVGDMMIEARDKKLDKKLKQLYQHFYNGGTGNVSSREFQQHFTSREIKIKPKYADVHGLQLADLLAHPACVGTYTRQSGQDLTANYGGKVYQVLETAKYRRSPSGKIDGWGRKWLP